ncbi:MAG: patatin-like phospholipase family protein [Pseudomonadota bacterium]
MTDKIATGLNFALEHPLPRIGLALGGGAARGLAHIHALQAFDELGIKPSVIAGSSIGALYGAAFASGLSASYIHSLTVESLSSRFDLIRQLYSARTPPLQRLLNVLPLRSALIDPLALLDILLPKQMAKSFDQLEIPLRIIATNLTERDATVLRDGDLRSAIGASMAIPVLFSPVEVGGDLLADGSIVNPLPYDVLQDEVDLVVAVDVSGGSRAGEDSPSASMYSVLTLSAQIVQKTLIQERLVRSPPDVYVEVELDQFGAFQFHKADAILSASEPLKDRLKSQLIRVLSSEKIT